MHKDRIKTIHQGTSNTNEFVVYWLQHTQRIDQNYALYEAINYANKHKKPLKVVFVLNPNYPEANERHFAFMLEGLKDLFERLSNMGIYTETLKGSFEEMLPNVIKNAYAFFLDKAYTNYLRAIKSKITEIAKKENIDTFMVESDLIVPIEIASQKCEYAARTIRPKLLKLKSSFLTLHENPQIEIKKPRNGFLKENIYEVIKSFPVDHTVKPSPFLKGGEGEALKRLDDFIENKLNDYKDSNDPTLELNSYLSPYLHFGMISPVRIYFEILSASQNKNINQESVDNFLEQLLVRRELAFNFIYYHEGYDQFETMTDAWAYKTMEDHENDEREYLYTIKDYEALNTHDIYFNQAMKQMIELGIMPNYMRMYWGKKIIEWSKTYKEAYETTLYLNNKYFLDGRDANSYTGVAWLYGRHDRAWTERKIFGKLRYMNENGLKRKFDMKKYVEDL